MRYQHTKFIEQFTEYSPTADMHDDIVDIAVSMAITWASNQGVWTSGLKDFERLDEETRFPQLNFRGAP